MYFPPKTTRKCSCQAEATASQRAAPTTIKCAVFTRSCQRVTSTVAELQSRRVRDGFLLCFEWRSVWKPCDPVHWLLPPLPAALHLCQCNPLTYFHQWNATKILGNVRKDERVATQHLLMIAFIICTLQMCFSTIWNISLKSKSFKTPYIYLCDSALTFLLKVPLWPTASLKTAEKTTLIRLNTVVQRHQH